MMSPFLYSINFYIKKKKKKKKTRLLIEEKGSEIKGEVERVVSVEEKGMKSLKEEEFYGGGKGKEIQGGKRRRG